MPGRDARGSAEGMPGGRGAARGTKDIGTGNEFLQEVVDQFGKIRTGANKA